ncbi:AAA family ATPase [Streptobacillus moniliformis]|uniref:AAA family ATPase n=1 Tax=Streptobacillus moniliformis TaxID=34105 RepID=UPI0007E332A9|nr:AAA family ATPase [Streptobacillus moniliformis]
MERYYLCSISVSGIKNICNPIKIDFLNSKKYELDKNKIKGIFGKNGAGKTAIIKAVETLQKIVLNPNFLSSRENILMLNKLINFESNEFNIEVEFLKKSNIKKKYTHSLKLLKIDNEIKIIEEHLKVYSRNSYKEINIVNGEIKLNTIENNEVIKNRTINLLDKNSIINLSIKIFGEIKEKEIFLDFIMFYFNLLVFSHDSDNYIKFINTNEKFEEYRKFVLNANYKDFDDFELEIPRDEELLSNIYETVNKKIRFLNYFVNNLKNIEIMKDEDVSSYKLNFLFVYENYKVDLKFESMGIKNLFKIYDYIASVYSGRIVLIDEIDLSIHDIYLNKLIEFLGEMGKGQFIFTAHNISLLDTLKKFKKSIFFINESQEVINWVKRGNSSPRTQYKDGYIKDLPFNIDYFDFVPYFEGDKIE